MTHLFFWVNRKINQHKRDRVSRQSEPNLRRNYQSLFLRSVSHKCHFAFIKTALGEGGR